METKKATYYPKFITDWCITILNFFLEGGKNQALYKNLIQQTHTHSNDNNKKELNSMLHTVYAMAMTSPEETKRLLDEKLKREFGRTLTDVTPAQRKNRRLKGKKLEELQFMGDWSTNILKYMSDVSPMDPTGFVFANNSIEIIKNAVESNDFRGMKMAYNEINEMTAGLTTSQLIELNKILKEKFGRSLVDEEKEINRKIKLIIKRGKIMNDEEFYLSKSYIDELIIQGNSKQVENLDRILFEYEQKKVKN